MKKIVSIAILTILSLCCIFAFAGCGKDDQPVITAYTVSWKNYDGAVLEVDNNVEYGATPSYDGKTPTKPSDSQYSYYFNGWSPSVSSVTGNTSYTAQFSQTTNKYTITWKNYDGSTLKTDSVEYGTTPSYNGTPTKPSNAQYSYSFSGWSPSVTSVTGDKTYTAQFTQTTNKYTITWKNYDGSILEVDNNVEYGATPSYDGKTPTKPSDSQYSYSFNGWSPEVSSVVSNKTYTAQFTQSGRLYTVYFNLNGGSSPSYSTSKQISAIEKENFFFNVKKVGYNFRGWAYKGTKVFDEYGNIVGNVQLVSDMTFDALFVDKVKLTIVKNIEEAGSVTGSGEYAFNSEVDIKAITNDGYEFIGWYYNEDVLSNQTTYKYKMWDKDLIVEARFQVASYKLQIDSNNSDKGIVAIDPSGIFSALEYSASTNKSIKWKQSVKIAAYSKTEQTRFLGWYDDEGNLVSTNAVYEFEMPYNDINYHAKWNCFSISYTMNGGTNNKSNPTIYDVDSGNIELLTPTKSGATFVAWYCDGKIITSIDTSKKSNITVEAVWSNTYYTVKYSLDGGKSYTTVNYSPADGYTLANPTKNGYTFTGWTGSNGTTPQKNIVIKSKEIGNRTYVANWQISTYSITYSLNGGNLANKVTSYTVEDQNIQLATPTRDYYNFSKWQIDGKDVTYINTSLAKNLTVVAIWTPIDYTITYNLDGGTASNATKYNIETSTFTLTNPTKTGYTFTGWTGSNGSTPQMNVSIAKGGHTNLTYKANWEVNNYSISYVLNGGENNASNKTTYNINSGTISLYNPTRDYYNFKEWQLNGQKVTSISSSSTLKDITLTAIWTPIDYTITYNLDGGTASNVTKYNIETSTFTLTNPTKTGYTFTGWTGSNGSTPQTSVSISKGSHDNLSYTANWQINQYTLTFNTNGGSAVGSVTQNYGTELNIEKPTYYEKSFAGWFDSTLSTEYMFTTMPAENLTLYAKWIEYAITLTCDDITAISENDTINAELFNATAIDTDGNIVDITTTILSGKKEAGNKALSVRILATGLYDVQVFKIVRDIKVYGNPIIDYNELKDYINTSDVVNATLFNATSNDTFGNNLPVSVSIKEGTYEAGDTVTIVLKATDVAKNTTTVEVEKVKVYGGAVFARNEEIISIKDSDIISNELFGVSATDHFGVPLSVTTELYSGSKIAGKTITVKSYATDCKGNTSYITYQIKVYGTPSISNATKTDFKVEDEITLSTLGIVAKDSFGVVLSNVTLVLTEGTQTAGQTLTYKVTATDSLGNVAEKDISEIKVYGVPTLAYDCERLNYNQNPLEYVAPVTVSFNLNGGSGSIASQTIDGTQGLVYPSIPMRSGYAFAGWYTTSSCSTCFDFSANVTSDTTVYAKWIAMTSSYSSREYVDIANYNSSSSKKTISISASSSSSQNYYYFTCYAAGTYTIYSAYTSGDFYITAYNVTEGSTVLSKYNLYSSQSSKSATFTANAGDVIYIALYKYNSSGSTGSGTFYVTGVNYPKAGGLSAKKGADSVLNIIAKDSFGQDLIPEVTIKEGTFEGGKTVVYTLSVTDIAGNKKAIDTNPIKVYSPEDISLTYRVNSNKIKLSSQGEEFNVVAVNSFGEQCAIHLEAADGYTLAGGNTVNLYIVATDIFGNTTKSDLITNMKIYDMPTLTYLRDYDYIQADDSPYVLFVVKDSFGVELMFDVEVLEGSLDDNTSIAYRIKATDGAKNNFSQDYSLLVLATDESIVDLYFHGKFIGSQRIKKGDYYIVNSPEKDVWYIEGTSTPLTNNEGESISYWDNDTGYYILTTAATWNINYILNGGVNSSKNNGIYTSEDVNSILYSPTKTNSAFGGWYLDSSYNQLIRNLNTQTGDITLYAKWFVVGDKIEYGSYPQKLVTNSQLNNSLNALVENFPSKDNSYNWTSYKYINYTSTDDFMWYLDLDFDNDGIFDYRGVYFEEYRQYWAGSIHTGIDYSKVDDNGYYINNIYWFAYEPIKWTVFDVTGNVVKLCSNIVLDSQCSGYNSFDRTGVMVNWLNGNFYNWAFTNNEKISIAGEIRLLSKNEANKLEKNNRIVYGTDYANCQGLGHDDGVTSASYWLSTPYGYSSGQYTSYSVYYVDYDGSIQYYSKGNCDCTYNGVRPCIEFDYNFE